MTNKVVIVDYGVGNLLSVARAFEAIGATVALSSDPKVIQGADRVVLPGVGAFGDCMQQLMQRKLGDSIHAYAGSGRPLLGICVGMQMLFDVSEEFGEHKGLGIMPGRVVSVPATTASGQQHKIPHIGWSELEHVPGGASWEGTILADLEPGKCAYFVHSFMAMPENPENLLAVTSYNDRQISAAVAKENIYGTQFHPEKSAQTGLAILKNFMSV